MSSASFDIVAASYGRVVVTDRVRKALASAPASAFSPNQWTFTWNNDILGAVEWGKRKCLTIVWRALMSTAGPLPTFSDFFVSRAIEGEVSVLSFNPTSLKAFDITSKTFSLGIHIIDAGRKKDDVTNDARALLVNIAAKAPDAKFVQIKGGEVGNSIDKSNIEPNFVLTYAYKHDRNGLIIEMKARWQDEPIVLARPQDDVIKLDPEIDIVAATYGDADVTYTVRQLYAADKSRDSANWSFFPISPALPDPAPGLTKAFVVVWRPRIGFLAPDQPLWGLCCVSRCLNDESVILPNLRNTPQDGLNLDLLTMHDLLPHRFLLINAMYITEDVSIPVLAIMGKDNIAELGQANVALGLRKPQDTHHQSYVVTYARPNGDGAASIVTKTNIWSRGLKINQSIQPPPLHILGAIWSGVDVTSDIRAAIGIDESISLANQTENGRLMTKQESPKSMSVLFQWGEHDPRIVILRPGDVTELRYGSLGRIQDLKMLDHQIMIKARSKRFYIMAVVWAGQQSTGMFRDSSGNSTMSLTEHGIFRADDNFFPDLVPNDDKTLAIFYSAAPGAAEVLCEGVLQGASGSDTFVARIELGRKIVPCWRAVNAIKTQLLLSQASTGRLDQFLVQAESLSWWALEDSTWKSEQQFWSILTTQAILFMTRIPEGHLDVDDLNHVNLHALLFIIHKIVDILPTWNTPEFARVARLFGSLALHHAGFQQFMTQDERASHMSAREILQLTIWPQDPLYACVTQLALLTTTSDPNTISQFRTSVLDTTWFNTVLLGWIIPTASSPWGDFYQTTINTMLQNNLATIVPDPRNQAQAEPVQFLKGMSRILMLCKDLSIDPDMVAAIIAAGYMSAHVIGGTAQDVFIGQVTPIANALSLQPDRISTQLSQLLSHATIVKSRNQRLSIAMAHYVRSSGIAACDDFTSISGRENVLDKMILGNRPNIVERVSGFVFEINDYSDADSLSVVGPAAYLVEILNFLPVDVRDKLFTKRPDIKDIQLTNENITIELPYIDLANEVMESYIQNLGIQPLTGSTIKAYNTATDSASIELIEAPQNIENAVYQTLQQSYSPSSDLPFNLGLAKQRAYLPFLKTSRQELLWTFRNESEYRTFPDHVDPALAEGFDSKLKRDQFEVIRRATDSEILGLSHSDFVVVTKESWWAHSTWYFQRFGEVDSDPSDEIHDYRKLIALPEVALTWGYTDESDMQSTDVSLPDNRKGLCFPTEALLPRSGLSLADYISLANTMLIGPLINPGTSQVWSGVDTGTLLHQLDINTAGWDRIQMFLRLAKRSGFSFEELDEAIKALDPDSFDDALQPFSPAFIADLATLKRLTVTTGLDALTLLNFFSPMSIVGDRSLWSRLFMKRSILRLDTAFVAPNQAQPPPLADHLAVLLAAISCTPAAFAAISRGLPAASQSTDGWQTMSVRNIHLLYRCVCLARVVNIPTEQVCDFISVFPDCFKGPRPLEKTLVSWSRLSDAGINLVQLRQLLINTTLTTPNSASVVASTMEIVSGLHKDLLASQTQFPKQISILPTIKELKRLLCSLLPVKVAEIYSQLLEQRLPVVEAACSLSLNIDKDAKSLLPSNLRYISHTNVQAEVVRLEGLLSLDGISKTVKFFEDRGCKAEEVEPLIRELSQKAKQQAVAVLQTIPLSSRIPSVEVILLSGDDVLDSSNVPAKLTDLQRYLVDNGRTSLENKALTSAFGPTLKSCNDEILLFLLKNVMTVEPGIGIVEDLRNLYISQQHVSESSLWSGYFSPPSTGDFIFMSQNSQTSDLFIDGRSYAWTQHPVTQHWVTEKIPLSVQTIRKLAATNGSIACHMPHVPGAIDMSACFISNEIFEKVQQILLILQKLDLVIGAFELTFEEIVFLYQNRRSLSLDIVQPQMEDLLKLCTVLNLRSTPRAISKSSLQNPLLEIMKMAMELKSPSLGEIVSQVCTITGWDGAVVEILIPVVTVNQANDNLILALQDFRVLKRLFGLVALVHRYSIDSSTLQTVLSLAEPVADILSPTTDLEVAEGIAKVLRRHFGDESWNNMVTPVNNKLREQRRDAMIAYLLQQDRIKDQGVTDANDLFNFFLIDVQMGTALHTSRIKQAISVVQVFVQRVQLGLEVKDDGTPLTFDIAGWQKIQKYTVWAANLKIQLFPENWLSASLLDVKSSLFKSLESKVKQGTITWNSAGAALLEYLWDLDDTADLLYVAQCPSGQLREGSKEHEVLHVFARTLHTPSMFYYRRKHFKFGWSMWESMDLNITVFESDRSQGKVRQSVAERVHGSFIIPINIQSRLFILVPKFAKTEMPGIRPSQPESNVTKPDPPRNMTWNISLSWSEYRNGKWTPLMAFESSITDTVRLPSIPANESTSPSPVEWYAFKSNVPNVGNISVEVLKQWLDGSTAKAYSLGMIFIDPMSFKSASSPSSAPVSQLGDAVGLDAHMITFHQLADGSVFQSDKSAQASPQPKITNRTGIGKTVFKLTSATTFETHFESGVPPLYFSGDVAQWLVDFQTPSLLEVAKSSETAFDSIAKLSSNSTVGTSFDNFGAGNDGSVLRYSPMAAPYSAYNWEIAVFIPMLFVESFLDAQQFDSALKMIRYVFNPLAKTVGGIWPFPPFQDLYNLTENDTALRILKTQDTSLKVVENTAYDPHAVARSRISAYMKWIVMKYIEVMIAYGDYYFRQNTLESLPEAIQCYVQAAHLRGSRELMPGKTVKRPATYATLNTVESNFVLDFETDYPDLSWILPDNTPDLVSTTISKQSLAYFGILHNEKAAALKDTIDDRLFKIRHSMDINGNVRTLALFEPAIDPGLLVQAAASGSLNLSNTLAGLDAPLVHVRFSKLLQNALDICYDLRLFWASLLAAKQSKDAEALAALQAQQASSTQTLALEMKKLAVDQAQKTLDALRDSRKEPEGRLRHFAKLINRGSSADDVPKEGGTFEELDYYSDDFGGYENSRGMSVGELAAMAAAQGSAFLLSTSIALNIAGSGVAEIPTVHAVEAPVGMGAAESEGGLNFAKGIEMSAKVATKLAELSAKEAEAIKQLEEYLDRFVERKLEYNEAGLHLMSIDKQIEIQETAVKLAEQDEENLRKSIEAAAAMEDFFKSKYTNVELYLWLQDKLQDLYYQTYTLVYDIAQKAERVYRFERGIDSTAPKIIDFGYWDIGQAGALAGEKLYVGLRKLQQAYDEARGYDFEIKKKVSLRQIDPVALYELRSQGSCTFWLPELVFDMDFPGHYKRRIKSVTIRLPTSAGGQVSATLTLMEHKYRASTSIAGSGGYPEAAGGLDVRFHRDEIPINAIGMTESDTEEQGGVFNLDFNSDTFLPFEGAGAISKWSLEISEFSQLDPASVVDVVMQIQYTTSNGAGPFKDAVISSINTILADNSTGLTSLFDLPIDIPSFQSWKAVNVSPDANNPSANASINGQPTADPSDSQTTTSTVQELNLEDLPKLFPFFARASKTYSKLTISAATIIADFGDNIATSDGGDNQDPVTISLVRPKSKTTTQFNAIGADAGSIGQNNSSLTKWVANIKGLLVLSTRTVEKDPFVLRVTGHNESMPKSIWLLLKYSLTK